MSSLLVIIIIIIIKKNVTLVWFLDLFSLLYLSAMYRISYVSRITEVTRLSIVIAYRKFKYLSINKTICDWVWETDHLRKRAKINFWSAHKS